MRGTCCRPPENILLGSLSCRHLPTKMLVFSYLQNKKMCKTQFRDAVGLILQPEKRKKNICSHFWKVHCRVSQQYYFWNTAVMTQYGTVGNVESAGQQSRWTTNLQYEMLCLGRVNTATHGLLSAVGRTIASGRASRRRAVIHTHSCTGWNSKSEGSDQSLQRCWRQSSLVESFCCCSLIHWLQRE